MTKNVRLIDTFILMLVVLLCAVAGRVRAASPLGWWMFDEGSGTVAYDSSGNGFDGTIFGNPQWVARYLDDALLFDGTDDYVDLPIGSVIGSLTNCTVTTWVDFSNEGGSWQRIFDFGSGEMVNMFLTPRTDIAGPMRFAITTAGNTDEDQTTAPATLPSGWHHVAVTIDADNNTHLLYLDGEVVAENTAARYTPSDLGNTSQNWLGRSQYIADAYFDGCLDDVRIYDRVLSQAEIQQVMRGEPELAHAPDPSYGETDVLHGVVLGWEPGDYAPPVNGHRVYCSADYDSVYGGLPSAYQGIVTTPEFDTTELSFSLEASITYYWRVDEANSTTGWDKGHIWRFTTAPLTAYNPRPSDGAEWVKLDADITWDAGFAAVWHKVYFGTDPEALSHVATRPLEEANYAPGPLEVETTYYWRVDEDDGVNPPVTGDTWRFTTRHKETLVGWWRFDEDSGTTACDSSGNGFDGTLVGYPEWVPGYLGGALQFDGTDDYVDLPIGSLISSLSDCTIATWVNWSGQGGAWQRIFDFGSGTEINMFLTTWQDWSFTDEPPGTPRFAITITGLSNEDQTTAPEVMPIGWHHMAVTIDPDNTTHSLYIDGQVVSQNTAARYTPSDLDNTTQNWLGRSQYVADAYFSGSLDDFRIYNWVLTEQEIKAVMLGGEAEYPFASWPNPPDGAEFVEPNTVLTWTPGAAAASHDVYFGTDEQAVAEAFPGSPEFKGNQVANSYYPGLLELGRTYYWRIDEVNDASIWKGDVWSFTVGVLIIVDDDAPYDPGPGDPNVSDPNENGSWEHPFDSIQEAIDVAWDGETITVLDGTYTGIGNRDIDFLGKAITVLSQNGPNNCIIDCENQGRGLYFHSGEDANSVLEGFTITGGFSENKCGAIYCANSSPTIINCVITDNKAWQGGGIFCYNSSTLLSGCIISNNEAFVSGGGGLACWNSSLAIFDSTIMSNSPDGVLLRDGDAMVIGTVWIVSNNLTGNGIFYMEPDATFGLNNVRLSCDVSGAGTIQVPAGKELVVENDAIIDLYGADVRGTIQCDGLLKVMDNGWIIGANVNIARASFEGNAIIVGNVITTQAETAYGQVAVKDTATIIGNDIYAGGDRYLDLNPALFEGVIEDNRIFVTIAEDQNNIDGELFELRGLDLFCPEPPCEPNVVQLEMVPYFDPNTWTVERFMLAEGAKVTLTNRYDFQPPYETGGEQEVLYVRQLILGPNSVLDTGFNRLYYENIVMDPTAQIVNLPLLTFSLDDVSFDDEDEFANSVVSNNLIYPEQPDWTRIHIERVTGSEPDPNGMMLMRNLRDLDPQSSSYEQMISARSKGLFAKAIENKFLIRFEYLFNTSEPGVELVIYLSDVPELLAHNDPQRAEHYLEVARIPAPPPPRPGSAGSGRFGVFEQIVSTGHLNFTDGIWVEMELFEPEIGEFLFASGFGFKSAGEEGASVLVNSWSLAVQCYYVCLDISGDTVVAEEDFLMVIGGCGLSAVGDTACLDGVFSRDGIVNLLDAVSWDWAMNSDDRLLNCCAVPLVTESVGMTSTAGNHFTSFRGQQFLLSLPGSLSDLLIVGKRGATDSPSKLEDRLYVFDDNGLYFGYSNPASVRCNIRLVRGTDGQLYQLNSETGLSQLGDANEVIIPAGEVELTDINEPRYNKTATVYVGIQNDGPDATGRPILDAAFDENYVYVVPVVVSPDGNEPYTAAAKLQLLAGENPPYQVVQLYDDPPAPGDNQCRDALREIELDSAGNLYVLNVHSLNESDILWRYEPNGAVERLDLGSPDSNNYLPSPIGMYMSDTTDMLYLASAQYNPADTNSTMIYGFSTAEALTLQRSITINGMHHVTSITEDPATGSLWIAGFNMEDIPPYPNPAEPSFYQPYLAEISYDSNSVQPVSLSDPNSHDLALPISVVWTKAVKCGGADLDHSGNVSFNDFTILAEHWLNPDCAPPGWCDGADINKTNAVDAADVSILTRNWLETGCLD